MRRRFIFAFVALFALFAVGIGTSLVFIWRGSSELGEALASHQIEELRKELSLALNQSQKDLEVSGTVFANQLDAIIANVQELDRSVQGCFDCHHEGALQRELEEIAGLVKIYKQQYSTFITAFLNPESRQRLQFEAAATAAEIDDHVDAMLVAAAPALQLRTVRATAQVERSWKILVVTLVLTFVVAIAISYALTSSVTRPLDRLVGGTQRVGSGEVGYRIDHHERHELGALMDAFNAMSEALESKTRRIEGYVEKLHRLNNGVVSLHAQPGEQGFFARQVQAIDSLVEVELRGSIAPTDLDGVFVVSLGRRGEAEPIYRVAVSGDKLAGVRGDRSAATVVVDEGEVEEWPFGLWAFPQELRNYLVSWIDWQGELRGALVAVNKSHGDFDGEDGELLSALGQSASVAIENASSYRRLQAEMEGLKSRFGSESPLGAGRE